MNRAEFSVRSEPVDLAETSRVRRSRRHEASAREFGSSSRAEGAESWVEADHDRLLQVASNLVENALRETPAGGVGHRLAPSPAARRLRHGARDPAPTTSRTPSSASTSTTRSARTGPVGSGLGLAIVKQLATAMGGDVSRRERPGRGTTFTVSLRPQPGGVDHLEVGARQAPERV